MIEKTSYLKRLKQRQMIKQIERQAVFGLIFGFLLMFFSSWNILFVVNSYEVLWPILFIAGSTFFVLAVILPQAVYPHCPLFYNKQTIHYHSTCDTSISNGYDFLFCTELSSSTIHIYSFLEI